MVIDKIEKFNKAMQWIKLNTINDKGITVTSKEKKIYPEVTGYYIPTLLQWGEKSLAISYAKYLCEIQHKDGSWYDPDGKDPYVFDSAQILKGLIAIRNILPNVDENIIKGCDWIISNMESDGCLKTPSQAAWGNDDFFCSDLVHIYCLSPIRDAGNLFNEKKYLDAVNKILLYYKKYKMDRILSFSLLSHFYAYVMEGLFDLGDEELVRNCMNNIKKYQTRKGGIVGLKDVPWTCSTGMFQLALVWYKLGELQEGNKIFEYACSLQNESGGWYGSYPVSKFSIFYRGRKKPFYFPDAEISWANKYFLDALALKEIFEYKIQGNLSSENKDKNPDENILINKLINARISSFGSV